MSFFLLFLQSPALASDSVLIVMPAYNAGKTISDSIDTVLSQTHSHWHLVVIDDASTDNTADIVAQYARRDSRIELIRHAQNSGSPAIARNTGLENPKEDYVAFLDADDLWLPEKLNRQIRFMKQENLDFSFTSFRVMSEDHAALGEIQSVPQRVHYHDILSLNPIGLSTVMINANRVDKISFEDEMAAEDYIMWLGLLRRNYSAGGLNEDLMRYRLSPHSLSANKLMMAQKRWRVYRVHEQMGLAHSAYYFAGYAFRTFYRQWQRRLALRHSQKNCEQPFQNQPAFSANAAAKAAPL